MKFFWSILARIYSDLILEGIKLPKLDLLFHKPIKKQMCLYQGIIFADINFTDTERLLILEGLDDLHFFCNGLIEIEIVFNLEATDEESIKNNNVLLRVDGYHSSIIEADKAHESRVLGLCEYMDNDTIRLYLVPERLHNHPQYFKTTAVHELGHFISLGHTKKPSIMHKSNSNNVLYLTKVDAKEMAKVWEIDIENLRYFRL